MNDRITANREVTTITQGGGLHNSGLYEPPALGAVGFILVLFSYMRN